MRRSSLPMCALAALGALAVPACADGSPEATAPDLNPAIEAEFARSATAEYGPNVGKWLAQLRRTTAPFHRIESAMEAGWDVELTPCLELEGVGGMGWHYADETLIDGTPEALAPELLLYEPAPSGKKRLVAVEYIIPIPLWEGEDPPHLEGVEFHRNEGLGLWVLHVWMFKNNPTGIFEDWNPRVSCDLA